MYVRRHGARALFATLIAAVAACESGDGSAGDAVADALTEDASEVAAGDAAAMDADPADADAAADTDASGPACPPAPPAPGEVRARVLGCEADLPVGRLVAARPGDLVLENSRARFVVRSGAEGLALLGLTGGNLVDAVRLGPDGAQDGVDGLREYVMTVDFNLIAPDGVRIADTGDSGEARVVVQGAIAPFPTVHEAFPFGRPEVTAEHVYVLGPDTPVLEMRTRMASTTGSSVTTSPADLMFWGCDARLFLPGIGVHDLPSTGFVDTVAVAPLRPGTGVPAYATSAESGRQVLNLGPIQGFMYDAFQATPDGSEIVRRLSVGGEERADLAGALAAVSHPASLRAIDGVVQGASASTVLEVRDEDGDPLSRCGLDADGAFACEVPTDAADVAATWLGDGNGGMAGPGQGGEPVSLEGGGSGLDVPAPEPASITLSVTDGEAGPVPFRLTARRGGEDPRKMVDGDGEATFLLPAGQWDLWVTHGPTRDWHHEAVELAPGEAITRDVALPRVVETSGWIAADLHVHAERSPDSAVPTDRRYVEALAEGLDYVVASEHDFVHDWAASLGAEAMDGPLVVRTGVEVSTMRRGHFNVWPLTPDPELSGHGAPGWHGLEMESLWESMGTGEGPLVQCNHPRFDSGGYAAFFDVVDPGPDTPRSALRCDTLEVINGYEPKDTGVVLADWAGMLDRGIRMTATGTSDTHTSEDFIGHTRTWVHLGDDAAADLHGRAREDAAALVEEALRDGRAVASSGPFLTLEVESADGEMASVGDTLLDPGDEVTARVVIEAPAWMPLGTLEVWVDGEPVWGAEEGDGAGDLSGVEPVGGLRRFEVSVPVAVDGADRWIIAWHHGGGAASPGTYKPPRAVTNPVFVDGDGDGEWRGVSRR